MAVNLFSGYFKTDNKDRQKELDFCLEKNLNNLLIDNVFTFKERFTYNDWFLNTQMYPNDINILANGDIYFNESLELALNIEPKHLYALTRWELVGNKIVKFNERNQYNKFAKPEWSQDAWIVLGAVKGNFGNYSLGVPGCDNRIAKEFSTMGYKVTNPSLDIKCIHVHKEEKRNYTINARVPAPYLFVNQTGLRPEPKKGIYRRI